MSAEDEKKLGSAAWAEGNYEEAIKRFSNAINLSSGDVEMQKILYSNRSASFLKVGQNATALADANKCIELDKAWSKGLVRKGDALHAMNRLAEASTTYTAALALAPTDKAIINKCEQVSNVMRSSLPRQPQYGGYGSGTTDPFKLPGGPLSMSGGVTAPATIQSYARIATVISFFIYLLPLGGMINFIVHK